MYSAENAISSIE